MHISSQTFSSYLLHTSFVEANTMAVTAADFLCLCIASTLWMICFPPLVQTFQPTFLEKHFRTKDRGICFPWEGQLYWKDSADSQQCVPYGVGCEAIFEAEQGYLEFQRVEIEENQRKRRPFLTNIMAVASDVVLLSKLGREWTAFRDELLMQREEEARKIFALSNDLVVLRQASSQPDPKRLVAKEKLKLQTTETKNFANTAEAERFHRMILESERRMLCCFIAVACMLFAGFVVVVRTISQSHQPCIIYMRKRGGEEPTTCCVCFEKAVDRCLFPCGHEVLCNACAQRVMEMRPAKCPVCRTRISLVLPVYYH